MGNVIWDNSYETWRWIAGDPAGWKRLGGATVPIFGVGAGSPDISYEGDRISATIAGETLAYITQGVWTDGAGWQETMPPIPPDGNILDLSYGSSWGLSGDGNFLTGFYWTGGKARPSKWSSGGGMIGLPVTPGRSARVNCANYDGSVVAGWEERPDGAWRPTVWRDATKITLVDTPILCMVEKANADGSILVGSTYNFQAARRNPARWVWNGASYDLTDLGVLPGTPQTFVASVWATGVTDDGSMIVGMNNFQDNGPFSLSAGFVWTPGGGIRNFTDVLADEGLSFPPDYQVVHLDISPDGSTIAGACLNLAEEFFLDYRAFVFRLTPLPPCADINGDSVVNTADLGLLIGDFGSVGPSEPADLNGDGVVDTADLGLLIEGFGEECF